MKKFDHPFLLSRLDGRNGFRLDGVTGDQAGYSVAGVGDVNGDGLNDIVIGAKNGAKAYIVFGSRDTQQAAFSFSTLNGSNGFCLTGASGDWTGVSVSSAGDVNGDNIEDIIIGAPIASANSQAMAGVSYVIFGSRTGFPPTISLSSLNGNNGFRLEGVAGYSYSGFSVSKAGDFNGDGIDDVIVGAYGGSPNGQPSAGFSYILFGNRTGFPSPFSLSSLDGTNGFRLDGVTANEWSGYSVASIGDVNGDRISDVVIGAVRATSNGKSYVVFGSRDKFPATFSLSMLNGANGFRVDAISGVGAVGDSVASAGDFNGDGLDDVIVGYCVVFGSHEVFPAVLDIAILNTTNGFCFKMSSACGYGGWARSVGDINSDGMSDIILGECQAASNGEVGSTYVLLGSREPLHINMFEVSSYINGENGLRLDGVIINGKSGFSVSGVDINGDNISDVIIGAIGAGGGAGSVYVVSGKSLILLPTSSPTFQPTLSPTQSPTLSPTIIKKNPLIINNQMNLTNGQTLYLSRSNLYTVSYQGFDSPNLIFVFDEVTAGRFVHLSQQNNSLTSFSQSMIDEGLILFIHAGNQERPSYRVLVTDGVLQSLPSAPLIYFADALVLELSQITVQQDEFVLLNESNFWISSSGAAPSLVQFIVANVEHGYFTVNGIPDNQFTQQELKAGKVRFIQDGTLNTPSYTITVKNTVSGASSISQSGNVSFQSKSGDFSPHIKKNELFIRQGDTHILTVEEFQALNEFNQPAPPDTQWIPINVQHGDFYFVANPMLSPPDFTQSDIEQGRIQFKQDGTRSKPIIQLIVESNQGLRSSFSTSRIFFQTINHAPIVSYSLLDQQVTVGESFTFGLPQTLFTDPDGDDVTFSAYQGFNHSALPKTLEFNAVLRRFNGIFYQPGNVLIQVEGMDIQGAVAATQFAIIAKFANIAVDDLSLKIRNTVITSVVGGVIGLGFFGVRRYLKKRMMHDLTDMINSVDSKTEQQEGTWKRETLLPFSKAFFDRFKTTGLCAYRNKQETNDYLSALTSLLIALKQNGIETDFTQLDVTQRRHLISITMLEIHKELVEKPRCCTRPWFFKMTRPNFTPEQLEDKVNILAPVIVDRFKRSIVVQEEKNDKATELDVYPKKTEKKQVKEERKSSLRQPLLSSNF